MKIEGQRLRPDEKILNKVEWTSQQEERFSKIEERIARIDKRIEQEQDASRKLAAEEAKQDFYEKTWANVYATQRVAERARDADEEKKEAEEREQHLKESSSEAASSATNQQGGRT